jgi:phage gpG-like protein
MPARITFTFYGEAQVDRTLANVELGAADARPAWEVIADDFLASEARQFASQGAYASGGWPPLSPKYAKWKALHYPGKPILRRTDELFESLTIGPAIRITEPQLLVIGSDVDYGRYHQTGTDRMPRRRPVELTENRRREWVRILQRFIVTGRPTV